MKKFCAIALAMLLAASLTVMPVFAAADAGGPPADATEEAAGAPDGASPEDAAPTDGAPTDEAFGDDAGGPPADDSSSALEVNTSPLAQGIAVVFVIVGGAALAVGIVKSTIDSKKAKAAPEPPKPEQ